MKFFKLLQNYSDAIPGSISNWDSVNFSTYLLFEGPSNISRRFEV